jgi:hypothetical protein
MRDLSKVLSDDDKLRTVELADMLKLCLREADYLNLAMVGIHLSNAIAVMAVVRH